MPLHLLCAPSQFYHTRQSTSQHIRTWFWLPSSSRTCVQFNKRPKPQTSAQVGGHGGGDGEKTRMRRLPQKPGRSACRSVASYGPQRRSVTHHLCSPSPEQGPLLLLLNLGSSERVWRLHQLYPRTLGLWWETDDPIDLR